MKTTRKDINELMTFNTSVWKGAKGEGKKLGRHWIFKSQFAKCWEHFQMSLTTVDWTKKQTAQSLFNVPYWRNMKFGTRIAIGRVLRHFVDNGWLPLVVLNPNATGTKYYERATPVQTSADQGVNSRKTGAGSVCVNP